MLGWFRDRARHVAATLLVSLVALGGFSSTGHASDCHDEECATALLPHDPSSHSISNGSARGSSHALHCVLCHWTRSIRPATETVHHITRPVADDVSLYPEVLGPVSPIQAAQPPLRSPPVAAALNS